MKYNSNIYKIVAYNIKKYRMIAKLTQKELADLSGYSYEYIRYIEAPNTEKSFSIELVYIISIVLKIPIYNFFKLDVVSKK